MRKLTILLIISLITTFTLTAQSPAEIQKTPPGVEVIEAEIVELPPIETEEEEIFTMVQQMPRFPGCEEIEGTDDEKKRCSENLMLKYIYSNLKYPAEAKEYGIEGMVVINFIVQKNGDIINCKILRNLAGGCGEEAVRVIESMPRWTPGRQNNKAVNVEFNLPLRFKLQEPSKPQNAPKRN